MFYLYHHHDCERLVELLAVLLERGRGSSPLVPEQVIVPNRGMERWLQCRLAENAGVAANIRFPLPASFIWNELVASQPDLADASDYSRDSLCWHLYRLLPDIARNQPAVARYLSAEPVDVHRLQLAERLADVFDQYQVYRGDMLLRWDAGRLDADSPAAAWQSAVWCRITEELGPDHRVRVLRTLIDRMLRGDARTQHLPLYCFGVADLPPDYLRVFYALGQSRDVHLLLPNPSDGYWGDVTARRLSLDFDTRDGDLPEELAVEAGHPLLASLGRPARDFIHLLYSQELAAIQEPELGEPMAYAPPGDGTLLQRIQSGIIALDATPDARGMDGDDVSLQVHACHGPLREVQVLHDQLLDLLARDPGLEPRDIVVMMPDPAAHAPAIRSVFGAAEGRRHIPWSLSDQPRWASHPIVGTFRDLLELPLSRWGASHVLALASVPAVMRRFGLDDVDLDNLGHWVRASGIRWGLDAGTRDEQGAGRYDQNTWEFGLDRLLLGSVMDDAETLIDDVAPWSDLEGGGTAALGEFYRLLQVLRQWKATLDEPRGASAWRQAFNELLERLFLVDPDDRAEREAMDAILGALDFLDTADVCLRGEVLSWLGLREALTGALRESSGRQPFLSGGVTFCSMQSLVGVPFRVVCLLGMNDGEFPRQDGGREFNLILHRRRLGDRSNRDADRLAFLQGLMSARDVFYLSYTGSDVRSGEPLEPATTVRELLDYIRRHHFQGFGDGACDERLITRQPMQPFGRRYFQSERPSRLFTFAGEWRSGCLAQAEKRRARPGFDDGSELPEEKPEVIELDRLRAFFREPPRDFLQQRLDLQLDPAGSRLDDNEPLLLDGLAGWALRADLLAEAAESPDREIPRQPSRLWQRRGVLPPPPLDVSAWQTQVEALEPLLPIQRAWRALEPLPFEIDLQLDDGTRLTGRLGDVRLGGVFRLRAGSLAPKHVLADWLDYLALRASGGAGSLELAGISKGALQRWRAEASAAEARVALGPLLAWFRAGSLRPLAFLPELAFLYLEERAKLTINGESDEVAARGALEKLNGLLDPDAYQRHRALQNPYFAIVMDPRLRLGEAPESSEFCRMADEVCGLLHARLADVEEEA